MPGAPFGHQVPFHPGSHCQHSPLRGQGGLATSCVADQLSCSPLPWPLVLGWGCCDDWLLDVVRSLYFVIGKWVEQGRRCHFLLFFPSLLFLMGLLLPTAPLSLAYCFSGVRGMPMLEGG